MANVIAIMNQKGGVGKTTTTVNLGAALAANSFRVLLVDLDPTGNMSQWLTGDYGDDQRGLSDFLSERASFADVSMNSASLKLDFVPSGDNLNHVSDGGRVNMYALKNKLGEVADNYDFIIIDCPPSSDFLVGNALLASNSIIIPIQTETLPLQAGIKFLDWLEDFTGRNGNSVNIMGILPCMYDSRTRLSKIILDSMKSSENIGPLVFDTVIRKNVRIAEMSAAERSIFKSASTSFGASDYADLAIEVIARAGATIPESVEDEFSDDDNGEITIDSENSEGNGSDIELVYQDSGSGEFIMAEPSEDD